MGKNRQNLSLRDCGALVCVAALLLGVVAPVNAFAEPRTLSAIGPHSGSIVAKIDPAISAHILAPSPLAKEDQFYRSFVSPTDGRVAREYMDRWFYHEIHESYGTRQSRDQKHINPGTLEFHDGAVSEREYRRGFAMQVLQLRLQTGVQEYLKTFKGLNDLKAVEKTFRVLESARTQSISFAPSKPSARPSAFAGSLNFGYDIFTDFSKLEYSCRALDFGFYHTFFLGSISGGQGRSLYSQLTLKPNNELPTPSLRYRFEASAVDLSLSKPLTNSLSASIATTQPIGRGVEKSYGMSVAYTF